MALTATVLRLKVQLADSDRGIYEALDLRLAQHPSETPQYLVTRALAYCLSFEEGIEFCKGGLSQTDEPAIYIKTPDGRTTAWIEVGAPSGERLHKASKACPQVVIYCHHDPELVLREARRVAIHRAESIVLLHPEPALITALSAKVSRNMQWELTRSGGQLYVTTDGETLEGSLQQLSLVGD
ncbi:MAG: YaeQ family protein [Myxococcales bacterium]